MKKFAGMSYVRQKNGRFFDFKNLLHVWICYFKLCELLGVFDISTYKLHNDNIRQLWGSYNKNTENEQYSEF